MNKVGEDASPREKHLGTVRVRIVREAGSSQGGR